MGFYRKAFKEDLFGRVSRSGAERRRERRDGHLPRMKVDELGDARTVCAWCDLPQSRWKEFRCCGRPRP